MANPHLNAEEAHESIKRLKTARDFDGFLLACQNAVELFPEDSRFLKALHDAQEDYVESKLESAIVKDLIRKRDYETLIAIYRKLLGVFPGSKRLLKKLEKAHSKLRGRQEGQLNSYYDELALQVKNYMRERDFEKAVQLCDAVLEHYPSEKRFIRLLVQAEEGFDKQMNRDLETCFKELLPVLKADYDTHKDHYVTL